MNLSKKPEVLYKFNSCGGVQPTDVREEWYPLNDQGCSNPPQLVGRPLVVDLNLVLLTRKKSVLNLTFEWFISFFFGEFEMIFALN